MEKLISNRCNIDSVPESYVMPPEIKPGKLAVPLCKSIPVVDLGRVLGGDRKELIQQIIEAGQEFGFFQIINNGKMKSVDHCVVTNTSADRTTIASFINSSDDSRIEPVKSLVGRGSPPLYRGLTYKDFASFYVADIHDERPPFERYMLQY